MAKAKVTKRPRKKNKPSVLAVKGHDPTRRSLTDRTVEAAANGAYFLAACLVVGAGTGIAIAVAQGTADALGFEDRTIDVNVLSADEE